MKRGILIFALLITVSTSLSANDRELAKETKIISEVIKSLEESENAFKEPDFAKVIEIYSPEGQLLHRFSEENIDPKAIRNADFLLEDETKKIFIKYRN